MMLIILFSSMLSLHSSAATIQGTWQFKELKCSQSEPKLKVGALDLATGSLLLKLGRDNADLTMTVSGDCKAGATGKISRSGHEISISQPRLYVSGECPS